MLFLQIDSTATAVVESLVNTFQSATCFSSASNGKLFVIDQKRQSLLRLTAAGKTDKTIGGQGWGNYEFDNPTDVTSSFLLDIYVTDYNNRRIQRYDSRLNFIETINENSLPSSIGRFYPRACALSSLGYLFVIETDAKRILKLNKRYQFEREFGTYKDGKGALTDPKDIAVSQADEIFVLDGTKIIVFDFFGNYTRAIMLPEGDWKSVQVSRNLLIATSSRSIMIVSIDGSERRELTHSSILGLSTTDDFVDATILNDKLAILTASTLYFCSLP